jgi:peptidoglycan/LPS O-acetylase OafA/YrhL
MAGGEPRRAYQTLDGMRAVGAFLVVTRHVPDFFGPFKAPESFLAVDLFYLVSGFVVAHAYGARMRQGGFLWPFFKTRLIRLYPLYLVGLMLGVVSALYSVITDPAGWWTWPKLIEAVATGLFMIPMFPGLKASGSALDGPIWTLLPELIANMAYAAAIRFLTTGVLIATMAACAAGVTFAEFHYGTLDVGYNATDQWAALARVGFSFFAGVLVFRLAGSREVKSGWASWGCLAVLAVMLGYTPSNTLGPWYELAVVIVGFPLLVALASWVEPGWLTGRVFAYLGLVSYGVYIIHQPIGHLARVSFERWAHMPHGWRIAPYGVGFLAFLVAVSGALDVWYDAPVRKWLRARFMGGRTG